MKRIRPSRVMLLLAVMLSITAISTQSQADTGICGGANIALPFTDVASANIFFCSIAEAFFSGLSNGTSVNTYSPSAMVTRDQMAAFVTRTLDQSLRRGSRRATLRQFSTSSSSDGLGLTTVGGGPRLVECDGADLWTANLDDGTVSRVRASDGKVLGTWTGAAGALGVLSAKGRIWVIGHTEPDGSLYLIDPTLTPGAVTTVPVALGRLPNGISFDGARIWTANDSSLSVVTLNPLSVNVVIAGMNSPAGILYDGANIWVSDSGVGRLLKLNSNGVVLQHIQVGTAPGYPVFDGTNIWVPNNGSNSVTVVRASTGAVVATLTGNGLSGPITAAFDGERILVTNITGNNVSLWKAADFTPLGPVGTGASTAPYGACSDGLNFWITLVGTARLARF